MNGIVARFEQIVDQLRSHCIRAYGTRLIALAVFGSVGRGTAGPDSDVDVLIVADELPRGRVARVREFEAVEKTLVPIVLDARTAGMNTSLSPVFKTPDEIEQGSPLLLDMIDDARILFDRADFLRNVLHRQKNRLERLGARRIWRGNAWYWDLKPDYTPGEVFDL